MYIFLYVTIYFYLFLLSETVVHHHTDICKCNSGPLPDGSF